jgi:hypothetical protein
MQEFVNAVKGGPAAMSNFDYAGPLTEVVVLGNLALFTDKKVEWDGPRMMATNAPELAPLINKEYRKGWELGAKAELPPQAKDAAAPAVGGAAPSHSSRTPRERGRVVGGAR